MRKFVVVALFVCLVALAGVAQETPKPEVFGGYQFTTLDHTPNANGWNGAASMYVTRWLGVTGDFSGAYTSGLHFMTYTAGPVGSTHKGNFSPFAHALFRGAPALVFHLSPNRNPMAFGRRAGIGHKQI